MGEDDDLDSPPAAPPRLSMQPPKEGGGPRHAEPAATAPAPRPPWRGGEEASAAREDEVPVRGSEARSGGSRVRGPAEVKAARRGEGGGSASEAEDPLPAGAKGADFKTLQEMIARGIQDAESGASKLEGTIPPVSEDDAEFRRHRELVKRRQEEELAARQKEREMQRERRRKEEELRQRRQAEQLEREEQEEKQAAEEKRACEVQCRRELAAAVRIQAHSRGRRSRAGVPITSPAVKAQLHAQPWKSTNSNVLP